MCEPSERHGDPRLSKTRCFKVDFSVSCTCSCVPLIIEVEVLMVSNETILIQGTVRSALAHRHGPEIFRESLILIFTVLTFLTRNIAK